MTTPTPTNPPRRREFVVRLRVSTKYDGRFVTGGPSRVFERGASLDGEEWREVAMGGVRLGNTECLR